MIGTARAEGIVRVAIEIDRDAKEAREEVRKVLGVYAQKVRSDAIRSIRSSTPAGIVYKVYRKGRKPINHQASAAGQAPAVISGRLWGSITADSRNPDTFEVGPTVNYGRYLEEGTSRMDPRPYMSPALEENISPLTRSVQSAINRAMGAT